MNGETGVEGVGRRIVGSVVDEPTKEQTLRLFPALYTIDTKLARYNNRIGRKWVV